MTTKTYQVGDVYWRAEGSMNGRSCDLGELGAECDSADEAVESAEIWLGDLTTNERRTAQAWIRQYRVAVVEDDGSIGVAGTLPDSERDARDGEHVE